MTLCAILWKNTKFNSWHFYGILGYQNIVVKNVNFPIFHPYGTQSALSVNSFKPV